MIDSGARPLDLDVDLPPQVAGPRRITKHPRAMHYNRLATVVLAVNVLVGYQAVTRWGWFAAEGIALDQLANLTLANFALAILIRQQYVINLLFRIATSAPTSWPLPIRWTLGKVYHFGGVHVGGAVAGTAWFLVFSVGLLFHAWQGLPGVSVALIAATVALLALLIAIVVISLPGNRARHHDRFERTHRFGGWAALVLFWVQSVLFLAAKAPGEPVADAFFSSLTFWTLVVITGSVALPWLRLKRVPVEIDTPSSHVAIAQFDYGVTPFAGSSTAISRNPLLEWHSFANAPAPANDGYRLTISRAGDWTGQFIDDVPSHVWVKGIPTAGVANIEKLFTRVVYVATGSGIGPCLPHLLAGDVPSTLVWSTRNPRSTYGDALVDEILAVQPDAVIWDTDDHGKPDMVKLAYQAYREFDAEAVICISNKRLTWEVVYGMESRGIPAYGAIWDS